LAIPPLTLGSLCRLRAQKKKRSPQPGCHLRGLFSASLKALRQVQLWLCGALVARARMRIALQERKIKGRCQKWQEKSCFPTSAPQVGQPGLRQPAAVRSDKENPRPNTYTWCWSTSFSCWERYRWVDAAFLETSSMAFALHHRHCRAASGTAAAQTEASGRGPQRSKPLAGRSTAAASILVTPRRERARRQQRSEAFLFSALPSLKAS